MLSVITSYFHEACVFYNGRQMIYEKGEQLENETMPFFVFS